MKVAKFIRREINIRKFAKKEISYEGFYQFQENESSPGHKNHNNKINGANKRSMSFSLYSIIKCTS